MGDAIISRRGGKAKLKSVRVVTPPTKVEYFEGDAFDPSGMVIAADIGGVETTVGGYTYTPSVIGASTTAITIKFTLDGVTKSATQSITAKTISTTLDNNDWDTIVKVAALGRASEFWKLGDIKNITIGGTVYAAQIIGFDFDDIDNTDSMYGNAAYNGGSNKAGITFRLRDKYSTTTYQMDSSEYGAGYWKSCTMRITTMPAIEALMPSELVSSIRTVAKKREYLNGSALAYRTTPDRLFLLSMGEYDGSQASGGGGERYPFYAAGNSYAGSENQWTRSVSSSTYTYFYYMSTNGSFSTRIQNYYYAIRPAFCV